LILIGLDNTYKLEVALDDKMYPKTYYKHYLGSVAVDETLAKIKTEELHITGWTLIEDQ
jgi:hypothetical protein